MMERDYMSIIKSITKGVLDTARFLLNVMFGGIIAVLIGLDLQGFINLSDFYIEIIAIVVVALVFNIIIAIIYDSPSLKE